jgi:hypothetical protein
MINIQKPFSFLKNDIEPSPSTSIWRHLRSVKTKQKEFQFPKVYNSKQLASCSGFFVSRENSPWYPLTKVGGSQTSLDGVAERESNDLEENLTSSMASSLYWRDHRRLYTWRMTTQIQANPFQFYLPIKIVFIFKSPAENNENKLLTCYMVRFAASEA